MKIALPLAFCSVVIHSGAPTRAKSPILMEYASFRLVVT